MYCLVHIDNLKNASFLLKTGKSNTNAKNVVYDGLIFKLLSIIKDYQGLSQKHRVLSSFYLSLSWNQICIMSHQEDKRSRLVLV